MSYTKQMVTIELEEYNSLLETAKVKESDLDYNEAYSVLISTMTRHNISLSEAVKSLNSTQQKYAYTASEHNYINDFTYCKVVKK